MRKIRKEQLTAFEIYQKMVKERYSMNGLWEEDYQAECLKILVWAYGELERMDFRRKGATPGQYGQEILCGNMNLYRALAKKTTERLAEYWRISFTWLKWSKTSRKL